MDEDQMEHTNSDREVYICKCRAAAEVLRCMCEEPCDGQKEEEGLD